MKRLPASATRFAAAILAATLAACGGQGDVKPPYSFPEPLNSSDYPGEIHPLEESIVLERRPYSVELRTTTRNNDFSNTLATKSTETTLFSKATVTTPDPDAVSLVLTFTGGESRSSHAPTESWSHQFRISLVLDLNDYSFRHLHYPGSRASDEIDALLKAFKQFKELESAYFGRPISAKDSELTYNNTFSVPEFGLRLEVAAKMTAVGTTQYLHREAVVFDLSMTTTGSNGVFVVSEGYVVVSTADGATLLSKVVSRSYTDYFKNRLLSEQEEIIEALVYDGYKTISTAYDGDWSGKMACKDCTYCTGPIEIRVEISIRDGAFAIVPDLSFNGDGEVYTDGSMRIWRDTRPSDTGFFPVKIFWFKGNLIDGLFELEGRRGERACTLELKPAT